MSNEYISLANTIRKIFSESATKSHTVPKTEKEKKLAALAHPKDKITQKDVLVGRGVVAKEEVKEGKDSGYTKFQKNYRKITGKTPEEKAQEYKDIQDKLKAQDAEYVKQGIYKKSAFAKEEASPMIKPPKNEFSTKADAFAHAKEKGGKVMKKTFTHPTTGQQHVSYVVKEEVEDITEAASEASKILKSSWADAGNNTGMHRRTGNSINVDYTTDKAKAEKHANKHVELLSKHGIKATPKVTRSERQGVPFYYHGVTVSEEVEQINELSKTTLASYAKKASHDSRMSQKMSKDFELDAKGRRDKNIKDTALKIAGQYQKKAWKRQDGVNKAIDRLAKEEVEIEEGMQQTLRKYVPGYAKAQLNKKMDAQNYAPGDSTKKTIDKDVNYARYKKVADKLHKEEVSLADTPGNGYEHQCAVHVKHSKLGEGRTLASQHANPDEEGNIEWYDVMFEHGIERVMTTDLEIFVSESHMHAKRKGKK